MRILAIAIACIVLGFGAAYLILPSASSENVADTKTDGQQLYTCGMHPEIISTEPGLCPICHMKLTPLRTAGSNDGTVRVSAATKQNMGLVTAVAKYENLSRLVHTFGEISVPDPNIYSITIKFDGWAERLFVDEEGERVRKGQPLFEVYSPDLVTAQKELLVTLKSGSNETMTRLAESARSRLLNWDISEDQLAQLEASGKVTRTMIIRSPVDGFVKMKHVNEGDRVSARSVLYEIADLRKVWVEADVYEQDLPYLSLHQTARVSIPSIPGRTFTGKVSYISPLIDERGQTEIRLELDNPKYLLKPAMYAEVTLENTLDGDRLVIPRTAVINSGVRQLVYIADADDSYEPRMVKTGAVGENDLIEVVNGLASGDAVVTSGQFLLDSETRLSEATQASGHMHGSDKQSDQMDHHAHAAHEMKKDDPYDIHTCPMPSHYHVLHYGPGTCPECGMDLVPVKETDNAPIYVCPMPECGTVTREPGNCPVCNMKLIEYYSKDSTKTDTTEHPATSHQMHDNQMDHGDKNHGEKDEITQKADDPYDIHTCPMPSHYHVLHYGPGECPECGMKLVPVSETDNAPVYVCPMPECGVATKEPGLCPVCNMHLKKYEPEAASDR